MEVRVVDGRVVPLWVEQDCSPAEVEEKWARFEAFETAPATTDRRRLARNGLEFPDPEAMPDPEVSRRLGDLIAGLAGLSVYLLHTDHLSDRELYAELVRHAIDVETRDLPGHPMVLDLLDHWVGRNEETYLRYYATPAERREARVAYPDRALPPAQERPYDRDRTLPWPFADGETSHEANGMAASARSVPPPPSR